MGPPRTSRRMILFSTIYLATVLIMTSSASASSNATPAMVSCEDIVASYQVMATVRRAFGCDLGFTNSGVPSACDEQILTSLKSCKPGNMSCLVSGITSTCNGHQDTCGATARVFLGLQQSLAVWCGSDSEPNEDCPWYKELGCTVEVGAAVAACSICVEQPELCEECVEGILEGSDCLDCMCTICNCC